MQAERMILETDEEGRVSEFPPLPPCSKVEAFFIVLDSNEAHPQSAGAGVVALDKPTLSPLDILKRIAAVPDRANDDGFSGEDHDKILYGWEKRQ